MIRIPTHFGALVILGAILVPTTFAVFEFLHGFIRSDRAVGAEWVILLLSFLLSFAGLMVVMAIVFVFMGLVAGIRGKEE